MPSNGTSSLDLWPGELTTGGALIRAQDFRHIWALFGNR